MFGCQLVLGSCRHKMSACSCSATCAVAFHWVNLSVVDMVFTFFITNLNVCTVWFGTSPQCSLLCSGVIRVVWCKCTDWSSPSGVGCCWLWVLYCVVLIVVCDCEIGSVNEVFLALVGWAGSLCVFNQDWRSRCV